jgi:hypothetical protein
LKKTLHLLNLRIKVNTEITIPDFKSISIEKPILELKDKDIDEQLEKLVSTSKEYNKVSTSKAKKGDQVTIDAVGYVDGKAFAGGKLDSHKLVLGSGVFIPGFEDQLIGAKTGDDVSVKVDFPKDYHEKTLAGKSIKGGARERAARAGSELLGEEAETLVPSFAANVTRRIFDDKQSLAEGLGKEAVETAFGTAPGAALAASGRAGKPRTEGTQTQVAPPEVEPPPAPPASPSPSKTGYGETGLVLPSASSAGDFVNGVEGSGIRLVGHMLGRAALIGTGLYLAGAGKKTVRYAVAGSAAIETFVLFYAWKTRPR